MTLILQCAVCGTYHTVGTTVCTTCRATGIQNLRLLFECPKCFRLGLTPTCGFCQPPAPVLPYEVVEDDEAADQFVPAWEMTDDNEEFELTLDDGEAASDSVFDEDDDDPEFTIDDE